MASQEPTSDIILTLPNNITVRRYRLTDAESLATHGNNKRIWNNLRNRMPHPYTLADSQTWINTCSDTSNWVASGPYTPSPNGGAGGTASGEAVPTNYVICFNHEAVGSIGLTFNDPYDVYARSAEIGYWLGEAHWGRGVMSSVVPAFIAWGWKTFGRLVRMNGCVDPANGASRRCLEMAGFVIEGRRKLAFVKNGELRDELFLGMLRPGLDTDD